VFGFLVPEGPASDVGIVVVTLVGGMNGVAIGVGMAVSRYGLYEIDRMVSRAVTYAVVVGCLALVFAAGAVWLPQRLAGTDGGLAVAVSTLVVFALFDPLRRRVQRAVDRRFHRLPYEPGEVAAGLDRHLTSIVEPDEVAALWISTAEQTFRPASAAIWVKMGTSG
jgi:hypothetical protein